MGLVWPRCERRRGGALPGARRAAHRARTRPLVRRDGAADGFRAARPRSSSASCWSIRSRRRTRRELAAMRGTPESRDGRRARASARAVWPSRAAARAKWAGKELFANWDRACFDLYLAEGLHDRSDGQVELACPPEIEATIFEAAPDFDVMQRAAEVRVPALVLWARAGNFPYSHFEALRRAHCRTASCASPTPAIWCRWRIPSSSCARCCASFGADAQVLQPALSSCEVLPAPACLHAPRSALLGPRSE